MTQLAELKCKLYAALLAVEPGKLTDVEINIAYELCRDEAIQDVLRRHLK